MQSGTAHPKKVLCWSLQTMYGGFQGLLIRWCWHMLAAFVVMVIDSPDSNNGELWTTVQPVDSLGHGEVT